MDKPPTGTRLQFSLRALLAAVVLSALAINLYGAIGALTYALGLLVLSGVYAVVDSFLTGGTVRFQASVLRVLEIQAGVLAGAVVAVIVWCACAMLTTMSLDLLATFVAIGVAFGFLAGVRWPRLVQVAIAAIEFLVGGI